MRRQDAHENAAFLHKDKETLQCVKERLDCVVRPHEFNNIAAGPNHAAYKDFLRYILHLQHIIFQIDAEDAEIVPLFLKGLVIHALPSTFADIGFNVIPGYDHVPAVVVRIKSLM